LSPWPVGGSVSSDYAPAATVVYSGVGKTVEERRAELSAGVLLTRVEVLKANGDKRFAVVDAAMNDLIRPAMYEAWHDIVEVEPPTVEAHAYDVVGPVCESSDWLGRDRRLSIREGDLLAIRSAGAYGMAMSSNYNTRPRGAEVVVDGMRVHLVRERERVVELFAHERTLPRD
ncbi:MAG: diaminopimelate decarboxylase family protein, partial [Burkholderiales bacterium]